MANVSGFNYTGGDSPVRLQGGTVTSRWFDVFGAKPILGRVFRPEEDQPGANKVAVLSFDIWNRLFGADRGIVGRTIELNQELYRVIGVMPANFRWPTQADIWVPLGLPADAFSANSRFNENYMVVARLRPGANLPAARNFMQVLTKRAEDSNPRLASFARSAQWSMVVEPFTELTSGNLEAPMLILLGAVGFVLLIACSNIAGLMLVRATGRARELAIRTSLGASRADLVKQAFAEAILLSLAGTATGILAASAILNTLLSLAPAQLGSGVVIRMDMYVLLFAIGVGLFTALLFGLAPAWHMSRLGQDYAQLKEGGRSDTEGHHRQKLRGALVAAQVALALVLLVGCRSLHQEPLEAARCRYRIPPARRDIRLGGAANGAICRRRQASGLLSVRFGKPFDQSWCRVRRHDRTFAIQRRRFFCVLSDRRTGWPSRRSRSPRRHTEDQRRILCHDGNRAA